MDPLTQEQEQKKLQELREQLRKAFPGLIATTEETKAIKEKVNNMSWVPYINLPEVPNTFEYNNVDELLDKVEEFINNDEKISVKSHDETIEDVFLLSGSTPSDPEDNFYLCYYLKTQEIYCGGLEPVLCLELYHIQLPVKLQKQEIAKKIIKMLEKYAITKDINYISIRGISSFYMQKLTEKLNYILYNGGTMACKKIQERTRGGTKSKKARKHYRNKRTKKRKHYSVLSKGGLSRVVKDHPLGGPT